MRYTGVIDLNVIRSDNYIINIGSGGGEVGGRIVVSETLEKVVEDSNSVTAQYLK